MELWPQPPCEGHSGFGEPRDFPMQSRSSSQRHITTQKPRAELDATASQHAEAPKSNDFADASWVDIKINDTHTSVPLGEVLRPNAKVGIAPTDAPPSLMSPVR